MAKIIKISRDYFGDPILQGYEIFSKDNIEDIIHDFYEEKSDEELKDFKNGVIGTMIYDEYSIRDWDDPSGYYYEIVDYEKEIESIKNRAYNEMKELIKLTQ